MNKRILISMLVLTLSGHSSLASAALKEPTAVTVVAEQVQTHQINQSLSLVGKLEAVQSVVIASEVSGKVESIQVKANQNVRQGQLLIKLEDDKALAAQTEANAYLKDEQRKLKEYERLVKRNAITQTEIDAQKASVEIAEARLAAAKASLNDLHISAPFAGTVGFINFSRGKLVSSGTELLTLDDLSLMQLDLHIPERYLSQISLGMAVTASSNAWKNETFQGKIVGIDSRINAETLNLRVRIQFANPENKLKPGMLLNTALAFPAIEAPIIPVQALEYSGTKRYVYVIDENNKARRTEVLLGARVENQVVIESGVNIGDKIVVQGIVNMRDGVLVKELGSANNAQPATKKDS
ncbi:efflux transporter periplasmic adaptor subunit [Vibrio navarrensis]|uniref:efflux RND transporter periplasmic adaptor subunit n=1 Tax=Vibrio navarrensis TaxID=29495 RepID=UPI00186A7AC0|nr:efflux RND transporter periplasmic adaptor subunit [Vibrio navarrensis]MBE4577332.1 efflux transporter periplasmic adaptor subunit [Vibrio navarrensis]MBE4587951.1 efflux transporter periplasmic adaptor subunit [Vibrio navarrensis]MBE4596243.1 efflux transporter periplasmic adaptor subunit [Vibrio navarrensis]